MASFNALSTALSTSWDIFKTSTRLLSHRKALLFFPIAAAATLAVFIVALIVLGLLLPPNIDKTSPQFVRAALAIDYVILLYVALFWQTALITQTTAALQGEKPSFTRGFAAAVVTARGCCPGCSSTRRSPGASASSTRTSSTWAALSMSYSSGGFSI